jgi:excisionase family DNA binding protein
MPVPANRIEQSGKGGLQELRSRTPGVGGNRELWYAAHWLRCEAALEHCTGRALTAVNSPDPLPRHADRVYLDEPLLTAADVAKLLAVPRSSIYEYARRRSDPLPSIGVGRHRRFYRSDVEAWLAALRA